MDFTTNGIVITDAIKFVQNSKDKLKSPEKEEDNNKNSKKPDYNEDEGSELEEKQEKETGEIERRTTNQVFWICY